MMLRSRDNNYTTLTAHPFTRLTAASPRRLPGGFTPINADGVSRAPEPPPPARCPASSQPSLPPSLHPVPPLLLLAVHHIPLTALTSLAGTSSSSVMLLSSPPPPAGFATDAAAIDTDTDPAPAFPEDVSGAIDCNFDADGVDNLCLSLPSPTTARPSTSLSGLPAQSTPTEGRSPKGSGGSWHLPFTKLSPAPRRAHHPHKIERSASQVTMKALSSPPAMMSTADAPDKDREVGVAMDGSYVETTSLTAAKALAKYYEERAREEGRRPASAVSPDGSRSASDPQGLSSAYVVITGEKGRNGKDVYRIRPRSRSPPPSTSDSPSDPARRRNPLIPSPSLAAIPRLSFTSPSPVPKQGEFAALTINVDHDAASNRKSLRASQSNPVLRQSALLSAQQPLGHQLSIPIIEPDAQGFYRTSPDDPRNAALFPLPATFQQDLRHDTRYPHTLQPGVSTSQAMFLHMPARSLRGSVSDIRLRDSAGRPNVEPLGEADVLGRILGWGRYPILAPSQSSAKQKAPPALPDIFKAKKRSGGNTSRSTTASSSVRESFDGSSQGSLHGESRKNMGTAALLANNLRRLEKKSSLPPECRSGMAIDKDEVEQPSTSRPIFGRLRSGTDPGIRDSWSHKTFTRQSSARPSTSNDSVETDESSSQMSPFGSGVRMPESQPLSLQKLPRRHKESGHLSKKAVFSGLRSSTSSIDELVERQASGWRTESSGLANETSLEQVEDDVAPDSLLTALGMNSSQLDDIGQSQEADVDRVERFKDASVFDLFLDHSTSSARPNWVTPSALTGSVSTSTLSSTPATSPVADCMETLTFGYRGKSASTQSLTRERMSSTISLASLGSSAAGTTSASTAHQITLTSLGSDDSRFIVWGERHVGSTSTGHKIRNSLSGSDGWGHKRWSRAINPHNHSQQTNSPHLGPSDHFHGSTSTISNPGGLTNLGSTLPISDVSRRTSVATSGSEEHRPLPYHQKLIMAATLERWVAELTSKIDLRGVADFFLAYRSVLSPLQLCHLLIARFDWALGPTINTSNQLPSPKSKTSSDEALKRIVRVRTFVVVRHWLLNHFEDDFLRDKVLRSCLTSWLNGLAKDERIKCAPDDVRIVKNLKKVVKQRKETFIAYNLGGCEGIQSSMNVHSLTGLVNVAGGGSGGSAPPTSVASMVPLSKSRLRSASVSDVLREAKSNSTLRGDEYGGNVSDATGHVRHFTSSSLRKLKMVWAQKLSDDDVDLDVGELASSIPPSGLLARRSIIGQSTDALPRLMEPSPPGPIFQSRKSMSQPVGLSALAASSDLLPLQHKRMGSTNFHLPHPQQHGTLSRYFTTTMGTLGRFKRMLKDRSVSNTQHHSTSSCLHAGPFDDLEFQPNETGDLLYVRGGLERYLNFFDLEKGNESESSTQAYPYNSRISLSSPTTSDSLDTPGQSGTDDVLDVEIVEDDCGLHTKGLGIVGLRDDKVSMTEDRNLGTPTFENPGLHESISKETITSEVAVTPGRRRMPRAKTMIGDFLTVDSSDLNFDAVNDLSSLEDQSRPTSVQLDDIDLSDESDDDNSAPRKLRRLPAATDLKQAITLRRPSFRRSIDTTSSIGTRRVPSIAASIFRRNHESSHVSINTTNSAVTSPGSSPPAGGIAIVDNFVAEGLESDDDEPGDVEAALRRLEGVIDADREKQKARKVEAQMLKSKKASQRSRTSVSDDGGISDDDDDGDDNDDVSLAASDHSVNVDEINEDQVIETVDEVPLSQSKVTLPRASFTNTSRPSYDTLKTEVTQTPFRSRKGTPGRRVSRKTSLYKLFGASLTPHRSSLLKPTLPLPPVHRSFLLNFRTEVLAKQFSLIERDLLRAVTWQELLCGNWQGSSARSDTLSWELFLKERAKEKMAAKSHGSRLPARDITAVIARFNLTCHWVASEIVLTSSLEERVTLLSKFIRLAFKCYRHNNFQTLTQIIHGLQTSYVERLKKTWSKLGIWENRMFRDLKAFTSHLRNFRSLRSIQDQLVEAFGVPGEAVSATERVQLLASASRSTTLAGCIPFLGIYLRDLTVNEELPTYLDPTDPRVPAQLDPDTDEVIYPSVPEVFDQLRLSVSSDGVNRPIYPLVNVHKLRIVASVVQKVLSFQASAQLYDFEADSTLFLACLKIKTLDADQLRRSSYICEA